MDVEKISVDGFNLNVSDAKARDMISDKYDPDNGTYVVGDTCINDDVLYICNTDIDTPEDFDSSKWDADTVGHYCSELKSNLIELSENTSITTTELTGYSTLSIYTISEEGNYAISTANGSATNNLIVVFAPNDSSNNVFYQFNYMSAPPYATVMTPIFHIKAGTYKIRATGSTSMLWKYS